MLLITNSYMVANIKDSMKLLKEMRATFVDRIKTIEMNDWTKKLLIQEGKEMTKKWEKDWMKPAFEKFEEAL